MQQPKERRFSKFFGHICKSCVRRVEVDFGEVNFATSLNTLHHVSQLTPKVLPVTLHVPQT
jgi:hypothetical protein